MNSIPFFVDVQISKYFLWLYIVITLDRNLIWQIKIPEWTMVRTVLHGCHNHQGLKVIHQSIKPGLCLPSLWTKAGFCRKLGSCCSAMLWEKKNFYWFHRGAQSTLLQLSTFHPFLGAFLRFHALMAAAGDAPSSYTLYAFCVHPWWVFYHVVSRAISAYFVEHPSFLWILATKPSSVTNWVNLLETSLGGPHCWGEVR